MPQTSLMLDACIAINLAATGRSRDLEQALQLKFLMAVEAARECGSIDLTGERLVVCRNADDGGQAFVAGVLSLLDSELAMYVKLAADIDDGEAATTAIAHARSVAIATDDRKACRVITGLGLPSPVSTSSLLHDFESVAGLSPAEVGETLRRVRDKARYVPRRTDALFSWWEDRIQR
ncbi:hypothetical protein [Amycolatopsis sp. GM8]|uniref:hypothetical protein n=1 Tax=Amycolatopsis sp. GM8 TaxID=2896530 RepID=UPI001F3D35A8|nr:hypothetical protein [Amycolatopsis sp. GM8]